MKTKNTVGAPGTRRRYCSAITVIHRMPPPLLLPPVMPMLYTAKKTLIKRIPMGVPPLDSPSCEEHSRLTLRACNEIVEEEVLLIAYEVLVAREVRPFHTPMPYEVCASRCQEVPATFARKACIAFVRKEPFSMCNMKATTWTLSGSTKKTTGAATLSVPQMLSRSSPPARPSRSRTA